MRGALARRVLTERARGLAGWSLGLVAIVALQVSVYPTIRDSQKGWSDLTEQFPEAFREILRISDYTTPSGYLTTELFTFVLPFIFIGVGAAWGARSAAEEEENGTADVLLSLPVSRSSLLATRVLTTWTVLAALGVLLTASLVVGTSLVDMEVPVRRIVAGAVSLMLLGAVFDAVALLVGSLSGRRGVALGASLGISLAAFVLYSLAPLVTTFDALLPSNPFQWTLGSRPLTDGLDAAYLTGATATIAVLAGLSFAAYSRRDVGA
ncbi:MAG: hypothetical protein RLZZ305_1397 [Actinomycetota bacterium]